MIETLQMRLTCLPILKKRITSLKTFFLNDRENLRLYLIMLIIGIFIYQNIYNGNHVKILKITKVEKVGNTGN